jgi:hypothetical protein
MDFVMAGNHMHEWGTSAVLSLIRGETKEVLVLRDDKTWSPEHQLNPEFTKWTVEEPLHVKKGDVIRTTCSWQNTSDEPLVFPKEMCIGTAFMMLPKGSVDTPGMCQNGTWQPGGV